MLPTSSYRVTKLSGFLLLLGILSIATIGQSQDLKFFSISSKDGLSQSTINDVVQDHDGYMWIATDDGLNRYDGQNTTIFKKDTKDSTTISDNEIEVLFVDGQGTLWVGTVNGGLNRFNKEDDSFTRFQAGTISDNYVTDIIAHDEDHLWISTNNGLNLLNTQTLEATIYSNEEGATHSIPFANLRCLLQDVEGTLWIGTFGDGMIALDPATGNMEEYSFVNDEDAEVDRVYDNRIRVIFEDTKGNLWIGRDGGNLAVFDRSTTETYVFKAHRDGPANLSNRRVTSIHEDAFGTLWIGTEDGLNIYDYDDQSFKVFRNDDLDQYSLSGNYVRCIFEDDANTIWIGTNTAGISKYHGISNKFHHEKKEVHSEYSLNSNLVLAFAEDQRGHLWVGTFEDGITVFDRENHKAEQYPRDLNKAHSKILAIHCSDDSLVWFGTWGGGINYYNYKEGYFGDPLNSEYGAAISDDDVTCLIEGPDGHLWLGTYGGGINRYDRESGEFLTITKEDGIISNFIFDLFFDAKGKLWVAAKNGLNGYDLEKGEIVTYTKGEDGQGLSSSWVHVIHEDQNGILWLGTKFGLNRLDPETGEVQIFHESDGLAGEIVYGILEDENNHLWISTTSGLSRFEYQEHAEKGKLAFTNYGATDGLQDNEFNQNAYYRSPSGELFFGGVNGFNHFYPDEITANPHIPNVVLTSFQIYGKEVKLDSAIGQKQFIELSYKDNFFSFEFAALDFISPEKNLYSYKMEGLNEQWSVPSNRPYANYTNLSGGDYIFRVKGSNNDGVWNDEGVAIHIRIIPPFYETTWFYTLSIIVIILAIFLFIRVREAKIKREKAILEEKVAQRTAELAQKNQDIMDSINYARRIQEAILPERKQIFEHLQDAFILYLPKDIVSGDFYWFANKGSKKVIAAVDCTGHGVPGAFMSMIGNNLLNQIVNEDNITDPGEILERLNKGVQRALKQGTDAQETNDGMDVALCVIDTAQDELSYAGAYRPLYFVSSNELNKTNGDKYPIGGAHLQLDREFNTRKVDLKEGDMFYIFSDGYPDQFGGPKGKKFMGKRFQQLILDICHLPMQEQRARFETALSEWAADYEQVDDILVIGVRY